MSNITRRSETFRLVILVIFAMVIVPLYPVLTENLRHVGYLSPNSSNLSAAKDRPSASCREDWLRAMSTRSAGENEDAIPWQDFLACGPDYLPLLRAVQPRNGPLAEKALESHPDDPELWIWLGDITFFSDPPKALHSFQKAVDLEPMNGAAWCRLGNSMNYNQLPQDATGAYMTCCRLEDPGYKGCYGAGRVYEKLGDIPAAIAAYRLSADPKARQRAAELEAQVEP